MDTCEAPLTICTDSLGALKALASPRIKSKIVLELVQSLNKLALERQVTLLWTPARSGMQGNVTADELARRGAQSAQTEPNSVNLKDEEGYKNSISRWLQVQTQTCWHHTSNAQHSKSFIRDPNREISERLTELTKRELRIGVGIITGHVSLNAHLTRIGAREDPLCDRCNMGEESGRHFICECPAWSNTRREVYGSETLTPTRLLDQPKWISKFADRSGRLANASANPTATLPRSTRNAMRRSMAQLQADSNEQQNG